MTNFLLKSGILLISVAAIFIVTAFFIFAFFSIILITPGLLFYNAGVKNIYKSMQAENDYDAEKIRIIDVSPEKPESKFVNKGKILLKKIIKNLRNFLNKYAD